MGYGRQRVWGTIGFGIAALIAGYAIDFFSPDNFIKSYTPTFILVMIFTLLDVISCQKLMVRLSFISTNYLIYYSTELCIFIFIIYILYFAVTNYIKFKNNPQRCDEIIEKSNDFNIFDF